MRIKTTDIRVSLGTAISLGLHPGTQLVPPNIAYLMSAKGCNASCLFCAQSKRHNEDHLSRIVWPKYSLDQVLPVLIESCNKKTFQRICLQVTRHPHVVNEIEDIFSPIHAQSPIPLSVSIHPLSRHDYQLLHDIGVKNVSISLDAVTPLLFDQIKGASVGGPYTWESHWIALDDAIAVFGQFNVTSHLIVGLGESERDFVNIMTKLVQKGIVPALFAFTPLRSTSLSAKAPPSIAQYRRVQLARYLIVNRAYSSADFQFTVQGQICSFGKDITAINQIIQSGEPFITTGCADCNRPFYNERVSGPWYNYPRLPISTEIAMICKELDNGIKE